MPPLLQVRYLLLNHLSKNRRRFIRAALEKILWGLIQMDASQFIWLGEAITHLHVAIDDASGNIVGAYFDTQETLLGYWHVLNQILTKHRIPVTIFTDKHSDFEYQRKDSKKVEDDTFTQCGYACHQIGIALGSSSLPQAKARVERLNATLQSRLPVDLALMNITTMEEANRSLKTWIVTFNRKFENLTTDSVFEGAPSPAKIN